MQAKLKKTGSFENVGEGLYRYAPTGKYYARIQINYKEVRKSLRTTDGALAKRRLRDLRNDLAQTGGSGEQLTLRQLCDRYLDTIRHRANKTVTGKRRAAEALKRDWSGGSDVQISKVLNSQVQTWLSSYKFGEASYNHYLEFIRAAFALAVNDRLLAHSPVDGIKTRKRKSPARPTPTVEEFRAIVASIREQPFSDTATDSGDLVEFMGLAGLGQAEIWPMTWQHINWGSEQITAFRRKTGLEFILPLYPQVRPLLERIRSRRGSSPAHSEKIFRVKDAKRAIASACERLNLPNYTPRSFRRLFITRALQRGADVKSVAEWQGHRDGGKLVLQNYSHVCAKHSAAMGKLMT